MQVSEHNSCALISALRPHACLNDPDSGLRQFKRVAGGFREFYGGRSFVLRQVGPEEVGLKEDREFAGEALLPAKLPRSFAQMRRDGRNQLIEVACRVPERA